MSTILHLFSFTVAVLGTSIQPRTAAQIQSDLQTFDTDLKSCTNICNSWTGDIAGSVAIQNCEQKVEADLKNVASDCGSSSTLTTNDSQAIINYVNNVVEPDLQAFISCIESRKAQFQADGMITTIQNDLKNIQSLSKYAGSCVLSKADSASKSRVLAAFNKIYNDIQGAIDYFAS